MADLVAKIGMRQGRRRSISQGCDLGSVTGEVRFYGLTPTSMKLEGIDRHQRLIESYKKLHAARAKRAGVNRL
ncbi:MAG TPA: hypothetical protein VFM75_07105 [Modicisalibacter sp.]|nr:hypothetical protein [Modicisalibacter sp.]